MIGNLVNVEVSFQDIWICLDANYSDADILLDRLFFVLFVFFVVEKKKAHRRFVGKGVPMVTRPSWSGLPWPLGSGIFTTWDQSWKLWLPIPFPTNPR